MDLVTSRELLRAATRTPGFGPYSITGSAFGTGGGDVRECSSAREDLPSLL